MYVCFKYKINYKSLYQKVNDIAITATRKCFKNETNDTNI